MGLKEEFQRILKEHHERLYATKWKLDNLEGTHKFLKAYNIPRLNNEKNRRFE